MTEAERLARGQRARELLAEFLTPVAARMEASALEGIARAATRLFWRVGPIRREAMRLKMTRAIVADIEAAVLDGDMARRDMDRKAVLNDLSPTRRNALR